MNLTRREALQTMGGGGLAILTGLVTGCASVPKRGEERLPIDSSAFKKAYATAIIGADTLLGGNIGVPSGRDHFIADQWTSGEPLPEIYNDGSAKELRAKGGVVDETKDAARQLIAKYNLLDMPVEATRIARREFDPGRAGYIARTMECMRLMIQHSLAVATGDMTQAPSFEERYRSVIGEDPKLEDPKEAIEILRASLADEGEEVTQSKPLAEVLEERNQKKYLSREQVVSEIPDVMQQLLALTRQNILSRVNVGVHRHDSHLSDVAFDGQQFNLINGVRFTASSAYYGGEDAEGKEKLAGLFEYNIDMPMTKAGLTELLAHESMPGHYFQSSLIDILRRGDRVGWEASIQTMCTGETAFHEGWANAALQMACGGSQGAVLDKFGRDFSVMYAADELESVAKNNAAIHFQKDGVTLEQLQKLLEAEYALSPAHVKKLSGIWAQDPVWGAMYSPAYLKGTQAVRGALERYGLQRVVEVGTHARGLIDFQRFKDEIKRAV